MGLNKKIIFICPFKQSECQKKIFKKFGRIIRIKFILLSYYVMFFSVYILLINIFYFFQDWDLPLSVHPVRLRKLSHECSSILVGSNNLCRPLIPLKHPTNQESLAC